MNTRLGSFCVAAFAAAIGLTLPVTGWAGNVGYYTGCADNIGIPALITTAGHTPIPVGTLDAGSLASLDGMVIMCSGYSVNPAVNAAVANGMNLFLEQQLVPANAGASLPGSPALVLETYTTSGSTTCPLDANLPPGSPITTGPGGTLTNTSLDSDSYCTPVGYATSTSLPAGSIALLTTGNPSEVGAFSYTYGNGRVVYSITQYVFGNSYWPGASTYLTNSIAWLLGQSSGPTTTCASEGYTGTKLTWCKNICENGLTGATLNSWIHRWTNKYRDLPYCAIEGGETPPPA